MTPAPSPREAAADGLRELSEAATPGPWEVWQMPVPERGRHHMTGIAEAGNEMGHRAEAMFPEDAAFIVACVNHVRAALAAALPAPVGEDGLEVVIEAHFWQHRYNRRCVCGWNADPYVDGDPVEQYADHVAAQVRAAGWVKP